MIKTYIIDLLFQFTAMIRLPDHVSKTNKMKRIDEIVDALHLGKCLDTSKKKGRVLLFTKLAFYKKIFNRQSEELLID